MKLFKTRKRASSRMVGSGVGVKRSVVTVFMIFLVAFTALPLIYMNYFFFRPHFLSSIPRAKIFVIW